MTPGTMEPSDCVMCVVVAVIAIGIAVANYYARKAAEDAYEEAESDYQEARRGWIASANELRREKSKTARMARYIATLKPQQTTRTVTEQKPVAARSEHQLGAPWEKASLN